MAPVKENRRVQFPRRGTEENDQYTGPDGQVTVDNQRRELRLHDGKKKGGWTIPNLSNLRKIFMTSDVEMGQLTFPEESIGFLTRTANKIYQLRLFQGNDGITVENESGVEGNPTIGLPERLKAKPNAILDANLAIEAGIYTIQKGADSNLPDAWKTTSDVSLVVSSNEPQAGGVVKQMATATQNADADIYFRRRVNGAWQAWYKKADPVLPSFPSNGNLAFLEAGVDETRKLWSAAEISNLVRKLGLESIQYVDAANAPINKLYNQLFAIAGVGAVTSTQVQGPFNQATGDRFEIVASATAVKSATGDSQTAQIAIEKSDGTVDVLATSVITILADEETKSTSVVARFIKTATGYQTADINWNVLATVTATLTGRIRVTTGIADQAGARAARWR